MPVVEHGINVTPGTGATVRTETVLTTFGTVDQEVVSLGSPTTAGNLAEVTATGELQTAGKPATAAVTTNPAASAANQQLLATNGNRLAATIYNASNVALLVRYGATAATTSLYTVSIPAAGYYELLAGWRGPVQAISASSPTGTILVTEMS